MTSKTRPRAVTRTTGRRPILLTGLLLGAALLGGTLWWQARGNAVDRLSGDFHALRVLPDGRLLYGQHMGVSVSLDGGKSWGPSDAVGDAMALATSPQASGVLVLAGHDVLKTSPDGGKTWRDASFGNLPGTDIHGFAVSPDAPGMWYANLAGRGLYRTENGQDWRFVSGVIGSAMALAVGPGQAPRIYALTMDNGLIVSDDGANWRRASDAPQAAGSGLDVHPVSGNVYVAGPAGVARSEDNGATWQDLRLPEGARLVAADPKNERKLYAAGESGSVYRSEDGGKTWSK